MNFNSSPFFSCSSLELGFYQNVRSLDECNWVMRNPRQYAPANLQFVQHFLNFRQSLEGHPRI